MIICLDIGNSQIYGGIHDGKQFKAHFRHDSIHTFSSDQFGLFLKNILNEKKIDHQKIRAIAISSVVPNLDYTLRSASINYFQIEPLFLQAGLKTGLKIKYRNPQDVGADRIANAIAAIALYPNKNIIIVDFGTATTFCAINQDKEYLGGVIMAGLRLSMNALQSNTAKLSSTPIQKPKNIIGKDTQECIQSGLYYGHVAAISYICNAIETEHFNEKPIIIGTGGFAHLFSEEALFTTILPDLVLQGLIQILKLNPT